MEAAVKVALPVATDAPRLGRSPEASGRGRGSSAGDVLGSGRWHAEVAGTSVGVKGDCYEKDSPTLTFWSKNSGPKPIEEGDPSCILVKDAALVHFRSPKRKPNYCKDPDEKCLREKSSKRVRSSGGSSRRSRVVQEESCKPASGSANGSSLDFVSSSASFSISGKNQLMKQKNILACGRGEKRINKVKYKNRCDSSFSRNGLVGFSSLGGTDFSGMYGLPPSAHDITKYAEELSLDQLLQGDLTYRRISEEKGKHAADSNVQVLKLIQKAYSVFRSQKVLQEENCVELESNGVQYVSTGLPSHISEVETGESSEFKGHEDQLSCQKDYGAKPKFLTRTDHPLYHPMDIFDRLALPQHTVSDLLLSNKSKITSSRNSSDLRSAKMASYQNGLPPFPWSHSFSGNNKLGVDAMKLSTSRAVCQGRWLNVKNSFASQKGSADLLLGFESLTFNENLVPPVSSKPEQPEDEIAVMDRRLSSIVDSPLEVNGVMVDERSPEYAAALTLLHIAARSKDSPCETPKLIRKPSQLTMKATKLNAMQRTDRIFVDSKSKARQSNPSRPCGGGFPSKKLSLSKDVPNTYICHAEPVARGPAYRSSSSLFKSRHTKLLKNSAANANIYGAKLVHKSFMMKRQNSTEWPNNSRQKFWKEK